MISLCYVKISHTQINTRFFNKKPVYKKLDPPRPKT